jgi:hypothetical protein
MAVWLTHGVYVVRTVTFNNTLVALVIIRSDAVGENIQSRIPTIDRQNCLSQYSVDVGIYCTTLCFSRW